MIKTIKIKKKKEKNKGICIEKKQSFFTDECWKNMKKLKKCKIKISKYFFKILKVIFFIKNILKNNF